MDTKVALVTGAGSGVGRATSRALLDAGWSVVLTGRRHDALEGTAAGAPEGRTLVVPADLRDPDAVADLFARTEAAYGRLDLLFNNAGVVIGSPIEDLSLDDWQTVVDTNLTAVFLCTREAFRLMKRQDPRGGRIINNGSVSAQVPRPDSAVYTATKHAVTGLTKAAALEGRRHDIACGQIDIGNALTDNTARMAHGVPQADGTRAVEPVMDVAHVAQSVLHMASLPLDANVLFMTVMATKMPLVGRG